VNAEAVLLTRVVRLNKTADKVLLKLDLVITNSDGRVAHNPHGAWVSCADGDWESASQKAHADLSKLLQDRINSPLLSGLFDAEVYHL